MASVRSLSKFTFALVTLVILTAQGVRANAAALQCREAFGDRTGSVREVSLSGKFSLPFPGERGRFVSVEVAPPSRAGHPVFVLLPGVNRSGRLSDESSRRLIEKGFGVAEMDFSVHPFSVATLAKHERPYFYRRSPELNDFAREVDLVLSELGKTFGEENLIPVSLSYSGAVSPMIRKSRLIVETVPMTSERSVNVDGARFRDQVKAGEVFNPIFGPAISRNLIDQGYRARWSSQADSMIENFGLPRERRSDYIEGYTSLSRASENATWEGQKIENADRRVFIFAEGENPKLLLDQLETYDRLVQQKNNVSLVVVEGSGHIIPVEKPDVYANALAHAALGEVSASGQITRLRADGGVESFAPGAEAQAWLANRISAIKASGHP